MEVAGRLSGRALARKRVYDRIALRIRKGGAPLLDREVAGWPERIDRDRLDLASYADCLLAQLRDEPYRRVVEELSDSRDHREQFRWCVRHGFDVPPEEPYEVLNDAWRNYLARRDKGTGRGHE